MEPESSLPYSQQPVTYPYPEPTHPVPTTPSHFLKIHLNIIFPSTSWSPQWSHSLRFPHQNLVHTSPFLHTTAVSRPTTSIYIDIHSSLKVWYKTADKHYSLNSRLLKMEAWRFFETSETDHPEMQSHEPGKDNCQSHLCENLKLALKKHN